GAQTIAETGDGVTLYASDNASVKVSAKEKNRSSVRAWSASIASPLFKDQNGTGGAAAANQVGSDPQGNPAADTKGNGYGAAFAVLNDHNETLASIGNNVTVYAGGLEVTAEKIKVTTSDYKYNGAELNGNVILGTSPSTIIRVNTTDSPNYPLPLIMTDITETGSTLADFLASHDYYVEAASGSAGGSFAVLHISDITKATMGDHVVLKLKDGGVTVSAKADLRIVAVAGAVAYGTDKATGASVIYTEDTGEVKAMAGDGLVIETTGNVKFNADADCVEVILSSAGVQSGNSAGTSFPSEGVLNICYSEKNIISAAGKDAVIGTYNDPSWDVSFNADYNFTRTDVTGGASVSKGGIGTGSAAGYIILKDNVIA
ncbi:MAG: hypothetical protein HUJ75_06560, partial [Parasporobacterium sp.]|nr:hypothetical protein [Parasporobacterium sp.]